MGPSITVVFSDAGSLWPEWLRSTKGFPEASSGGFNHQTFLAVLNNTLSEESWIGSGQSPGFIGIEELWPDQIDLKLPNMVIVI